MKVSAQYAAAHLDELLAAVDSGEKVFIESPNQPGALLALVAASAETAAA